MSLPNLPVKLLTKVLDYLGPSFFHEDIRRLTVSRQWFAVAHTVCFRDLRVLQPDLRRLSEPSPPSVEAAPESSIRMLRDYTEALGLELVGFEDWEALTALPVPPAEDTSQLSFPVEANVWSEDRNPASAAALAAWTRSLNDDLARLAATVRGARRLHSLRLCAINEHPPPHLRRLHRDYLSFASVRGLLLSVDHLTVLDLDLCGTRALPPPGRAGQDLFGLADSHVCSLVGGLLPRLQRLRLRLRHICPVALQPPPPPDREGGPLLRLREVAVNLSLSRQAPKIASAMHATRCGGAVDSWDLRALHADMEEAAAVLATQMAAPKTVRVLKHAVPNREMLSLDVLSGRRMVLAEGAAWEDDGLRIEAPRPEAPRPVESPAESGSSFGLDE